MTQATAPTVPRQATIQSPALRALFERKISRSPDGCWMWLGSKTTPHTLTTEATPIPTVMWSKELKKLVGVRRYAFTVVGGKDMPPQRWLRASCGKSLCVNPDHLEAIKAGARWPQEPV